VAAVNPSELRANIYRLLDQVLETGIPLEVERNGRTLRIVPDQQLPKLARLRPHRDAVVGNAEDLAELDWSGSWDRDPA
jgi:hypothetical protein